MSPTSPFQGTVTRELIVAAKTLRAHFEQVLAAEGEALSTFVVLDAVSRDEGCSQRALADGVRLEGATMTRHLDRLGTEGLVTRRRDPIDRRVLLVELTSAGRSTHERLREIMRNAHDACWKGIPERDRETTRRVAIRLSENVAALDEQRDRTAQEVGR